MSGDITEIVRELASRAPAVAEMLLPQGRKNGAEWEAGSIYGDKGQSLKVHLSGAKAGIWADFADSAKGGDLLDLWAVTKNLTIAQALEEARNYLGLTRQAPFREPRRTYTRPARPANLSAIRDRAMDYLTQDRNIPGEILTRYKVCSQGDRIIFPFLLPDGVTLILAKSREPVEGGRTVPTEKDCEPILFGWQAIPVDARQVVITEGEIDALSWAAFGHPALSVPFGGGGGAKQQWIESDYDRLDRFDKIFISTDMDEVGEQAAEEISSRLGRHRCYRVTLPKKDANECLVDGLPREDMDACIRDAKSLDPEGLKRPTEYFEELARSFWPEAGEHIGYSTPYSALGDKLLFRPAEFTLWSGSSGVGKSQVVSDCVPHWIKQGSRICIASFEMKGWQTLKRMVKQTGGLDRPTLPYLRQILEYIDRGVLIYEKVGKSDIKKLLEIFDYARAKYGCNQFVIDSMMRLGIAGDDYTGQEKAVFEIVDWTIKNGVHTHMVAHARKGGREHGEVPETEDIKGAMEIGANAFNIVTIWRNRKHEDKITKAKTDIERMELQEQPGVVLNVAKQRNGDFEGRIGLWFDQETYRYSATHNRALWGRQYLEVKQLLPDDLETAA